MLFCIGGMGLVGSSISSRIAQIFSKSLRKWCEKTTPEPPEQDKIAYKEMGVELHHFLSVSIINGVCDLNCTILT